MNKLQKEKKTVVFIVILALFGFGLFSFAKYKEYFECIEFYKDEIIRGEDFLPAVLLTLISVFLILSVFFMFKVNKEFFDLYETIALILVVFPTPWLIESFNTEHEAENPALYPFFASLVIYMLVTKIVLKKIYSEGVE